MGCRVRNVELQGRELTLASLERDRSEPSGCRDWCVCFANFLK